MNNPKNPTPSPGLWFLAEIKKHRLIIALDKYFGFHELTSGGLAPEGFAYEFDFMVWPKWDFVKIFTNLKESDVIAYAAHPRKHTITFILDGEALAAHVKRTTVNGVANCALSAEAFAAALALNAYLYFERRIWSSHLGSNIWEPILPLNVRILRERDWDLTKREPETIKSVKVMPFQQIATPVKKGTTRR